MPSLSIVPYNDPLEDCILGLLFGLKGSLEHQFILQAGPETLDDGVIPAVAHSAHAALDVELGEFILVLRAGVLAAAIGVVKDRVHWLSVGQGHFQGFDAEIRVQGVLHAPADDLSAEQVDDAGQVEEAFIGGDVGDIGGPFLIGCGGVEFAVEPVLEYRMRMIGIGGGDAELFADDAGDAVFLHSSGDGVDAAGDTLLQQIPVDVGASVSAVGLDVGEANGLNDPIAFDR